MLSLPNFLKKDEFQRRHFTQLMASSLLSVNTMNFSSAASKTSTVGGGGGKAKSCIFIQLGGGMSHVDSFDIKENEEMSRKMSPPIKTSADGIRIGKYFEPMAKHMKDCAVINSMRNTHGAHGPAKYLMRTGYDPRGTIVHPNLGSWTKLLGIPINKELPSYIKIGSMTNLGAGFLSSRYNALPIAEPEKGVTDIRPINGDFNMLNKRRELLSWMDQGFAKKVSHRNNKDYNIIYDEAVKLMSSSELSAFDLNKEPQNIRAKYGKDKFGQGLLLARRLVQADIRFVEISTSGFDWHYEIGARMPETVPPIFQSIDALLTELKDLGMLDSTLVAITTEFGRSVSRKGIKDGRNHHPIAYSSLLLGGGVKGGQTYGKTDDIGREVIENPVKVAQYNATIAYAMGLDTEKVIMSDSGRPFSVGDEKEPLKMLF